MNTSLFLSSRLSLRAIIGGTLSSLAMMTAFMMLAGGLGLWKFDLMQLPELGTGFWVFFYTAWIISLFVSSYVAAIASRSITMRDGALHGFVTWASACVFGCLFLTMTTVRVFSPERIAAMLWGAFIGDTLALGAALLGGIQATKGELQAEILEEKAARENRLPRAA